MSSWWRRLWGASEPGAPGAPGEAGEAGARPSTPPPAPPQPRLMTRDPEPPAMYVLGALGTARAPADDQALEALRLLTGGPYERAALGRVARAAAGGHAPLALCVRAAELLAQRGEFEPALEVLAQASEPAALLLRADLQAQRGDLAGACATAERLLARRLDTPGARERLERWRERLGRPYGPPAPAPSEDVTVLTGELAGAAGLAFHVVKEAGRGGSAAVYEARDEGLGRPVALKVYHRPREQREVIAREGRIAAALAGDGVARVYDVDLDAGWLAVEWAPLGTLRRAINDGDAALVSPAARWLDPLVRALAAVHGAGWVHGDLKPSNVLFRRPDEPLLADFGLARRAGEPWAGGSPGYLSPERLAGAAASPADDVYGLGRVIEDVLHLLGEGPEAKALGSLARACLEPAGRRPSLEGLARRGRA